MEEIIPTAVGAIALVVLAVCPTLATMSRHRSRRRTFQPRLYLGEFVPTESAADIRKREQVEAWRKMLRDAG